ncbi:hypothetical protein [Polaribacter sp. L3A8]|uniref:hypothetical protein n=1 Tax=Polaribacter sp. L3A8 TaxID=2686361 RepID=UPI00131B1F6A|nr:hypothetical protein [Polaribacter sp. L3A8]
MKIKSLLNKRNYEFYYNIIKLYSMSVRRVPKNYDNYTELSNIIKYFDVDKYDKIAVVASGPSSKNIVLNNDTLYFTTNAAISLVNKKDYVYVVNDSYYLIKYLKSFKESENWKGSVFLYATNEGREKEYGVKLLYKYLKSKSRTKREFLITNNETKPALNSVYEEFIMYIKNKLEIDFFGVNSGFIALALAYVLSDMCDKKLEIYGLDLGENGEGYFNKKITVGKSIKGNFTKNKVGDFLDKIYSINNKVSNKSYFKTKKNEK